MKQLFLVRHGVTALNEQRRYCGVTDAELSGQGLKQARLAARLLAGENISSIFSSPLKRCLQTCDAISQAHDIYVELSADLTEINFGEWEGLAFEEIQKTYPDQLGKWFASPDEFTFPQGESFCDFRKRVLAALENILKRQGNILIIAHGGCLRLIICHLCRWPTECLHSFELDPASLTVLNHYDKSTVIKVLNETCHLKNKGVA